MLLDIFFTFFRIGAFTIGGGYAMLPIIQREIVAKAEMTPGPIAINAQPSWATRPEHWRARLSLHSE